MGLFDIFTGDPAKKAAAENTARLQANQTAGTTALQAGQTGALDSLTSAGGMYAPLAAKYGAGTSLGLDSLGINGPEGNARVDAAFRPGPGYRYSVDQSLDGINRHAAATGVAAGGNTLAALSDRAGHMADQEFGNWQSKLLALTSPELAATSGMAGAEAAKAPVYTGTGNSIANLGTATTTGINDQNTQSANAQMAGSKNLWGFGMDLAKLGVGAATGGTSLLGGLGGGGTAGVMNVGGQQYPAFR